MKIGFDLWMERAFIVLAFIVILIVVVLALFGMVIIARSLI